MYDQENEVTPTSPNKERTMNIIMTPEYRNVTRTMRRGYLDSKDVAALALKVIEYYPELSEQQHSRTINLSTSGQYLSVVVGADEFDRAREYVSPVDVGRVLSNRGVMNYLLGADAVVNALYAELDAIRFDTWMYLTRGPLAPGLTSHIKFPPITSHEE